MVKRVMGVFGILGEHYTSAACRLHFESTRAGREASRIVNELNELNELNKTQQTQ